MLWTMESEELLTATEKLKLWLTCSKKIYAKEHFAFSV